jgi:hypothetical protein
MPIIIVSTAITHYLSRIIIVQMCCLVCFKVECCICRKHPRVVGIQAYFRYLRKDTPEKLFSKLGRNEDQNQHGRNSMTLVEWMNQDALDAKHDFFEAHIWDFPEEQNRLEKNSVGCQISDGRGKGIGKGTGTGRGNSKGKDKDGKLKEECRQWKMFRVLPSLYEPGHSFTPKADFDFWSFFRALFSIHQGAVRLAGDCEWLRQQGPPPLDKNYWHCQYCLYEDQQRLAESFHCRGGPAIIRNTATTIPEALLLEREDIMAIGNTTVCWMPTTRGHEYEDCHFRRVGNMFSHTRMLTFLVRCKHISMYVAEQYWIHQPVVCRPQATPRRWHLENYQWWVSKAGNGSK